MTSLSVLVTCLGHNLCSWSPTRLISSWSILSFLLALHILRFSHVIIVAFPFLQCHHHLDSDWSREKWWRKKSTSIILILWKLWGMMKKKKHVFTFQLQIAISFVSIISITRIKFEIASSKSSSKMWWRLMKERVVPSSRSWPKLCWGMMKEKSSMHQHCALGNCSHYLDHMYLILVVHCRIFSKSCDEDWWSEELCHHLDLDKSCVE